MDQVVLDTLRPMNIALGLLLLWTAWSDRARYEGPYAMWPVWTDVAAGGFMLVTAAAAFIRPPPLRWVHPWGLSIVAAICITAGTALAVEGTPGVVPSIALIALGSGIVFLSLPYMAAALGMALVTWYGVVLAFDVQGASQPGFLVQVAVIIAAAVGWARRRAYQQILDARDDARTAHARASRLNEELERFAQVVTHDLQTPLTALRLKARIARMAVEQDQKERAEKALLDIDRIANDSGHFVHEMLDYARSGEHNVRKEEVDLSGIVTHVAGIVEAPLVAVGGRLTMTPLPKIHGDPVQLRQLILNIVSNSIRYRREDEPLLIRVRGHEDPGGAQFTIEDNGKGFSQAEAAKLFMPFELGEHGEGHGLGLAMCKRIVDAHGGTISAEGRPGEGAIFTIELPRAVTLHHEAGSAPRVPDKRKP